MSENTQKRAGIYPMRNGSGYADPTAHDAMQPISEAEAALEARTAEVIRLAKRLFDLAGYDVMERIIIRDRESGKIFR